MSQDSRDKHQYNILPCFCTLQLIETVEHLSVLRVITKSNAIYDHVVFFLGMSPGYLVSCVSCAIIGTHLSVYSSDEM